MGCRPPRPPPSSPEARVGEVAALGRLDPGEFDAAVGDRVPINIALKLGHVDAVYRVVLRLRIVVRKDVLREDLFQFSRPPPPQPEANRDIATAAQPTDRETHHLSRESIPLSPPLSAGRSLAKTKIAMDGQSITRALRRTR